MEQAGRVLILIGGVVLMLGVLLSFADRLPFRIGRLPLDFHFERGNVTFFFPLGTSIVVSLVLSLLFILFSRR